MSATFERIRALVLNGDIRISDHGYDEISDENILARDIIEGVLEWYCRRQITDSRQGPSALSLQLDHGREPLQSHGESRRTCRRQRLSLRLIDPIPTCGRTTSCGGNHEKVGGSQKSFHEGPYVAKPGVELIDTDEGWSPYLSLEEASKWNERTNGSSAEAISHPHLKPVVAKYEPHSS